MGRENAFADELASRYRLSSEQQAQLDKLAEYCVSLEISGIAVRSHGEAYKLHVADSLAALELAPVREAKTLLDIGSGAGLPGLALAIALPGLHVTLLDSVRKKMEAAAAFARALELENVECVWSRVEEYSALGSPARGSFDVVIARALAPLNVLLEYAAPLLKTGGRLIAWKGALEEPEITNAAAAAAQLGMATASPVESVPFAGSRNRCFLIATQRYPAADRFPRRSGKATRKPLTA